MATTRKQGADDQNQDAAADSSQQQQNHAQTPGQQAANSGAFAQSSYQNTQQGGAANSASGSQHASTGTGSQSSTDQARGESSNVLDAAMQTGKKWLADSSVLNSATQLPQAAKEWGTKAMGRVSSMSTTQKVVGGALLLAGVAFLSTRGKSKSSDDDATNYRSGDKSSGYRQGSWAGYAGGKSA